MVIMISSSYYASLLQLPTTSKSRFIKIKWKTSGYNFGAPFLALAQDKRQDTEVVVGENVVMAICSAARMEDLSLSALPRFLILANKHNLLRF